MDTQHRHVIFLASNATTTLASYKRGLQKRATSNHDSNTTTDLYTRSQGHDLTTPASAKEAGFKFTLDYK